MFWASNILHGTYLSFSDILSEVHLRGIYALVEETTLVKTCFCHTSVKGSTLKEKIFLPLGVHFFSYGVDPFTEGIWRAKKAKRESQKLFCL